ncbi:MAG: hypothetical protein D6702_10150 [Planctomycetota bacterium]|nr:MAG: hypothetical protein D6702_10150 [Planctomycetota bacterium]
METGSLPLPAPSKAAMACGLRFGARGTHSSRTMMLAELSALLSALPATATRADYAKAIAEDNLLGKPTTATRILTNQRLGELYGLDPGLPLFRVLRRVWAVDEPGRPLIALLASLARDPLLRAASTYILPLAEGEELVRTSFLAVLRAAVGERMNDSILDKVARNTASSWTQSGHLHGRVRKVRCRAQPTPGAVAFALWLGAVEGKAGEDLTTTLWAAALDRPPHRLLDLTLQASRLGLVKARIGGGVTAIDVSALDPGPGGI